MTKTMRPYRALIERVPRRVRIRIGAFLQGDEADLVYQLLNDGRHHTRGTMVDVGANHGATLWRFCEQGWQVFAFEPDPVNRAALEETVGTRRNVCIDPRAVAEQSGESVPFFPSDEHRGLSSLSPFHPSHRRKTQVTTVSLAEYFEVNDIQQVDFLKIDIEGHDLFALRGVPWRRVKPRVVMCEFEDAKTLPLGHDYHALAQLLIDHGYQVLVSEWFPIRRYGGAHRWRRFVTYPTALEDARGWGNLIATRDRDDFVRLQRVAELEARKFRRLSLLSRARQKWHL